MMMPLLPLPLVIAAAAAAAACPRSPMQVDARSSCCPCGGVLTALLRLFFLALLLLLLPHLIRRCGLRRAHDRHSRANSEARRRMVLCRRMMIETVKTTML
ncbi:unnamed protein product [Lampetra fluviatilis]